MLDQSQWQQISQWIERQRDSMTEDYCAIIGLNQKDLENQGILA